MISFWYLVANSLPLTFTVSSLHLYVAGFRPARIAPAGFQLKNWQHSNCHRTNICELCYSVQQEIIIGPTNPETELKRYGTMCALVKI